MLYYAGIGSRETPGYIMLRMARYAQQKQSLGYILRSGGAIGADRAFESAIEGNDAKEIFRAGDATVEAIELASHFHPNWAACNDYARRLHGRNMMILLGKDLKTPVEHVCCWTKGGKAVGGTGQAIRAARHYLIPIINLYEY